MRNTSHLFTIASSLGFLSDQDRGETTRLESDSQRPTKPFLDVHSQAGAYLYEEGQRWHWASCMAFRLAEPWGSPLFEWSGGPSLHREVVTYERRMYVKVGWALRTLSHISSEDAEKQTGWEQKIYQSFYLLKFLPLPVWSKGRQSKYLAGKVRLKARELE